MEIPLLKKVPYTGSKVIRRVPTDWPACEDHFNCLLVRRHPGSLYWWCACGHHFITDSKKVMVRVMAYEVEDYPGSS